MSKVSIPWLNRKQLAASRPCYYADPFIENFVVMAVTRLT